MEKMNNLSKKLNINLTNEQLKSFETYYNMLIEKNKVMNLTAITDRDEVISTLGLTDITAVHGRAEEAARKPEYRDNFDVVVSRAVAALPVLSEYTLPFVKKGGVLISYKTPGAEEELSNAKRAIKLLGGGNASIYPYTLPDSDITRSFIVISKEKPTPKAYPRKAGTAKKDPL